MGLILANEIVSGGALSLFLKYLTDYLGDSDLGKFYCCHRSRFQRLKKGDCAGR